MKLTGYEANKTWFAFCEKNPTKVKPIHHAVIFWVFEKANQAKWKTEFQLPTNEACEILGISDKHTFMKAIKELIDFGFIEVTQEAKSMHVARFISLENCSAYHVKNSHGSSIRELTHRVNNSHANPTEETISHVKNPHANPTDETVSRVKKSHGSTHANPTQPHTQLPPNKSKETKITKKNKKEGLVETEKVSMPAPPEISINSELGEKEKKESLSVAAAPPLEKKWGEWKEGHGDGELHDHLAEFYKANKEKYPPDMYVEFKAYWTAKVQKGNKLEIGKEVWRTQKTFSIPARLATWFNRYKENNNGNQSKNTSKFTAFRSKPLEPSNGKPFGKWGGD